MKKIKLNAFVSRLLPLLLFIVVIAVAFLLLFIGCKGCERKESWDTIQESNNDK